MRKGDVIRLMATMLATILGEAGFSKQPAEFQKMAIDGAAFIDKMEARSRFVGVDDEAEMKAAWTPEDCQALFNLIAALQATQASECPIA